MKIYKIRMPKRQDKELKSRWLASVNYPCRLRAQRPICCLYKVTSQRRQQKNEQAVHFIGTQKMNSNQKCEAAEIQFCFNVSCLLTVSN